MNDAHEEDFHKQGYSEESLKMLKSEEGQLNAVYACFGSAMAQSQLFEDAVKRLVAMIPNAEQRKNLGQRIAELKDPVVGENVWESIDEARKKRNYLAHQYFTDNKHKLETREGRMEMLGELVQIETPIRKAKELVSGMCVWVAEALENGQESHEDITISLSDEIKKSHLPPYP